MILTLKEIEKSYGDHIVLSDITAKIEAGDRIGMIGINGAGKSTLLNIIAGTLLPDGGEVILGKDVRVGYLKQNTPLSSGKTIREEMRSVFAETLALEQQIKDISEELARSEGDNTALLSRLQTLTARYEAADGYNIDVRINQVLTGLGFSKEWQDRVVDHLSGGERVRLSLGKLLISAPELLMLDEPTNHLDFATLAFLESFLESYKGAVLMVSHDRYFLDRTVSEIWEIEQPHLVCYTGNYSKYKHLRAERRQTLEREYEKAMVQKAALEDYVARNLVRASTSAMAKSRQKQLEKLEIPTLLPPEHEGMRFHFDMGIKSGFDVLTIENMPLSVEGKQLCKKIELVVKRGEKIALVGQNGVGKTTLFRRVLQQTSPEGGVLRWGKGVRIGYFDQHGSSLDGSLTPVEQIRSEHVSDTDGAIRTLLAKVQLRGEAVFAPISTLSGGQKAGVSFAKLMRSADNVLLLDEPTNHLDLASRENLEDALQEYEGTILMISHDRYLLSKVPQAIYCMTPTGLARYATLEEYQSSFIAPPPKPEKQTGGESYHKDKKERARLAKRRSRLAAIEKEIAALEAENAALEEKLAQESDYHKLGEYCDRLAQNKQVISELTDEWLMLEEE